MTVRGFGLGLENVEEVEVITTFGKGALNLCNDVRREKVVVVRYRIAGVKVGKAGSGRQSERKCCDA